MNEHDQTQQEQDAIIGTMVAIATIALVCIALVVRAYL